MTVDVVHTILPQTLASGIPWTFKIRYRITEIRAREILVNLVVVLSKEQTGP